MLVKRLLKRSVVITSLLLVGACSTTSEKSTWDEGSLNTNQPSDAVVTQGIGDADSFYGDESNTQPLQVGNQTYYFDFDKSAIHEKDFPSLKMQARYLVNHPRAKVLITGNTDERGSREYNIALGQRRALSVTRFLQKEGVNTCQILSVSHGAEKPVAFGHTEADYAKNRRDYLQYQSPVITDTE